MKKNKTSRKTNVFLLVIGLLITINSAAQAQVSGGNTVTDNIDISEALQLINSPEPIFQPTQHQEIAPAYLAEMGLEQVYTNVHQIFTMWDGKSLFAYKYPMEESKTAIILLHGVLSSAYLMNKTAGLLRETTSAEVIALDFKGHGQSDSN